MPFLYPTSAQMLCASRNEIIYWGQCPASGRHFFADRGLLAFMLGQRAISPRCGSEKASFRQGAGRGVSDRASRLRCAGSIRSALLHLTNFQQNLLNGQSLHCVDTSACHFIWVTPPFAPTHIVGETGRASLHFCRGRVRGLVRFFSRPRRRRSWTFWRATSLLGVC